MAIETRVIQAAGDCQTPPDFFVDLLRAELWMRRRYSVAHQTHTTIKQMPAQVAGGPHTVTVSGRNTIELTNVLVGEVWLGSGQSNMEMSVFRTSSRVKDDVASARYPKIRLFNVAPKKKAHILPQYNVDSSVVWTECSPETVWALARSCGRENLVCSGPLYKSLKIEGSKIRLEFEHAAEGLASRDGQPLNWFQIADDAGDFVEATAVIDGQTVVVSSDKVAKPTSVRFGWNQIAEPNLINKARLPASRFRTGRS